MKKLCSFIILLMVITQVTPALSQTANADSAKTPSINELVSNIEDSPFYSYYDRPAYFTGTVQSIYHDIKSGDYILFIQTNETPSGEVGPVYSISIDEEVAKEIENENPSAVQYDMTDLILLYPKKKSL